jgi:hypothetical protein
MKKVFLFSLVFTLFFSTTVWSDNQVALTIYNQDLALVKDVRGINFEKGKNEIKFTEVASQIDPTSVHFKALGAENKVSIWEQNFQYDLVSSQKILQKYLDKDIELFNKSGALFKGKLLSYSANDLTISETEGSIRIVRLEEIQDMLFPSLPEGLITKPTLVWLLRSEISGKNDVEVSYLTTGINWHSEYVAVVDQKDENLELSGWVSIDNRSGATYQDAKLKLIAGEVHRIEERRQFPVLAKGFDAEMAAAAPSFEEKPFFEYHLYTLTRPATVKDNEIKQISLFSPSSVKANKLFIYDSNKDNKKISVNLEFRNSESEGLGIPLPEGKIRVYKKDVDQSLEFIGEDKISHTPKDEKVRLFLGNAFDIVGERKRTDYKKISEDVWEESYELKLRNHKEEKIEVLVVEHLYAYVNWEILEKNFPYQKKDANTIEFSLPINKNGEVVLNYTVRYVR